MSWARLDDAYYDNPKMLRVGLVGTGLHARAITYCARHETDGHLPLAWVDGQLLELKPAERKRVIGAIVDAGVFRRENGGYVLNDYLEYNPSKDEQETTRGWDRKRKSLFRDPELTAQIRARDNDLCRYCGGLVNWKDRRGPQGGTYDHVIPRGDNTMENVVVACRSCNGRKGPRTPSEAAMDLLPEPSRGTDAI